MRGVFRFSTDLSPDAGKYSEKSARRSDVIEAHGVRAASARTRRKSLSVWKSSGDPAIARQCRQRIYVTLSPPTAIDSTRPQLGHYFSNYNFRCAFRIHENFMDSRYRINPRPISPELRNVDNGLSLRQVDKTFPYTGSKTNGG